MLVWNDGGSMCHISKLIEHVSKQAFCPPWDSVTEALHYVPTYCLRITSPAAHPHPGTTLLAPAPGRSPAPLGLADYSQVDMLGGW